MAMGMLYIVTEWCLQSHLSTASMGDAARGLYLTRRFRWLTSPFRDAVHYAIERVYAVRKLLSRETEDGESDARQHRRSVRWTKRSSNKSPSKNVSNDMSMDDLAPGRPRASSDAPLIMRDDMSASHPSISDVDAASQQSRAGAHQDPRTNSKDRTIPDIESPSRLHVPGVRYTGDRQLSV
jgi:hypothetical protein